MDNISLELYLYMNSHDKIIEWLESEGIKTVDGALNMLRPLVQSNIYSFASSVGSGNRGGTLAGTNNCVRKVMEHFKNLEESSQEKS